MIHAQNEKTVLVIAPVSKTNSATASATFDLAGADYATLRISLSSEINTNAVGPTISVLDCDTSNGSFATITADRTAEDITAAKTVVYHIDLKTKKRYGKLQVNTGTTTNDDVVVSADLTLSRLEELPGSTSDMVGTTNDAVVVVS